MSNYTPYYEGGWKNEEEMTTTPICAEALNHMEEGISAAYDTDIGLYPVESASGDIAVIHDGADDLPVRDLSVAIEPVQAGTGTPSPSNVRAITGWSAVKIARTRRNLLPASAVTTTLYGVTFTVDDRGVVTAVGTSTTGNRSVLDYGHAHLRPGTYILSGCPAGGTDETYRLRLGIGSYAGEALIVERGGGREFTITEPMDLYARIYVQPAAGAVNQTWFPMIRLADDSATWTPSEEEVTDITLPTTVYGGTLDVTTGILTVDRGFVTWNGSEDWVLSGGKKVRCNIYALQNLIKRPASASEVLEGLQASYLTAQTDNATYQGTIGISCQTNGVVGITLTGEATTVDAVKAYLAEHPLQVVYPLATPRTYTLTPVQVKTLLGENRIYADAGQVTVRYRGEIKQIGVDPTLSVEGMAADAKAVGEALAEKADADAVNELNERLVQLKEPVVITHSETVEKGYHVLTFDEPILKGTEVTVIGTAATASNSFTAIFRDSNGNFQNLGTLGFSTKKLTGVLEFDAVGFRSYVNGTEWGFTITYGEGVVAEVEDMREGVNGVIYDSVGEAVRTQVKNTEDVINIVGQKTLSLLDIDPSATAENWTLIANGLCESNSNGRLRKYSVTPGQLLFLSISKDTYGVYQFQNNASIPASGINNYLVGYPITEAVDGFVIVPEGATYLIVSQLKTNVTNAIKLADSATDIISLNEGIRSLMIQAARPKNLSYNAYLSEPKPLMLLHFSDIHGDSTELARMVEFADSNSDMIDGTICTGDVLATRWSSDFNYWSAVPGAEKILLAVGNHDVLTDTSGWDWSQRASQADQYTRFFAPFIGGWECSYESGKTYYYKDYDDSKIRLVVLNCMLTGSDDTAQLTWLGTALSGAKAKDYSVVVANHYMIATPTKIPCNFSSIDKGVGSDVLPTAYLSAIQNFIDDGGRFVCHIAGHTHWDIVVRSQDYPRQICIVVDALSRAQGNNYSDTQRTNGDKSQDLANVVAFDTSSGVVKVIRVGADTDHYLRQKHCLTIDYATGNIVAES